MRLRRFVVLSLAMLSPFACNPAPPAPAAAPLASPPSQAAPAAQVAEAGAAEPVAASEPAGQSVGFAEAIVGAADRSEEDRKLDAGRMPAKLLEFIGVRPGAKVAEIGAAGGYTAELLARAVGPTGVVYGHNSQRILERFAEKPWSERLAKPVMKNVVRVDRDFDDPLPAEASELAAVVLVLFYHDTVWLKVDRERMNRAIRSALAADGVYVIIDHSARAGSGLSDVETLHRIDEQMLRAEVESAGFRLARSADFLRVPGDTRDWNTSPRKAGERRGTSDRFVLAFAKR
jgi:predicted methyltransferase